MRFLSSLDPTDRKLLLWSVSIALVLATATAVFTPRDENDNPIPSTYLAGRHGARAAYETLLRSGYRIERWEQPLSDLADSAGPETVVILAEPLAGQSEEIKALRRIVERGGRVLSTGLQGGSLLPGEASESSKVFDLAACKLEPEGFDALAGSGEVWMIPRATWKLRNPAHRVQFTCAGSAAVVEYNWGKGHIVWWASSTPLENGSINRAQNLDLLLNSIGPREAHHFYWDESLHGEIHSPWSYASGPSLTILLIGLPAMGLMILFSFSRRSGPLRDLPPLARATPIEFLEALGSLYRQAGAASTAVAIAWERFRRQTLLLCGQKTRKLSASELAAIIRWRFPRADTTLESDLAACEEVISGETISPRKALKLVETLHSHYEKLVLASRTSHDQEPSELLHSKTQERAS